MKKKRLYKLLPGLLSGLLLFSSCGVVTIEISPGADTGTSGESTEAVVSADPEVPEADAGNSDAGSTEEAVEPVVDEGSDVPEITQTGSVPEEETAKEAAEDSAGSMTVDDAKTYREIYAEAIADAAVRHEVIINNEDANRNYNSIAYTLCDINGDGFKELLIRQVRNKHLYEVWVYGSDGTDIGYIGEFECDADQLYGYKNGILYREAYKGGVFLGVAEYDGTSFSVSTIYNGNYDRDGEPPSVESLSAYYDAARLLDPAPDFVVFEDMTMLAESAPGAAEAFSVKKAAEQLNGQLGHEGKQPDAEWKAAYKKAVSDAIEAMSGESERVYGYIIYIDGDEIPEVALYSSVWADGTTLITWSDGEVYTHIIDGFSYIEKSGLICTENGHMGYDWTHIYRLEDGELIELGNGMFSWLPEEGVTDDQYVYWWDDEPVSEEEYNQKIDELFDRSLESDNGYQYSYPEILDGIDQFGSAAPVSAEQSIDLADYPGTDIDEFRMMLGDMKDVGASDAVEYSNDDLIVSAPYDETEIVFFRLSAPGTGYSVMGITCGMDYDEALAGIRDRLAGLIDSDEYMDFYAIKDGGTLRIDYNDDNLITGICIWAS